METTSINVKSKSDSASFWLVIYKIFFVCFPPCIYQLNTYACFSCKKLVVARKQMSVFQAPNILVIQLKVSFLDSGSLYCTLSATLSLLFFVCFSRGLGVFLVGKSIR